LAAASLASADADDCADGDSLGAVDGTGAAAGVVGSVTDEADGESTTGGAVVSTFVSA
jgi:hypothetical protein